MEAALVLLCHNNADGGALLASKLSRASHFQRKRHLLAILGIASAPRRDLLNCWLARPLHTIGRLTPMGTARTHGIHHASEEHKSRALDSSARNASSSTTLASFSAGFDFKGGISHIDDLLFRRPSSVRPRPRRTRPRPRRSAGLVGQASHEADGPRQR